jgi:hypothetical protein
MHKTSGFIGAQNDQITCTKQDLIIILEKIAILCTTNILESA